MTNKLVLRIGIAAAALLFAAVLVQYLRARPVALPPRAAKLAIPAPAVAAPAVDPPRAPAAGRTGERPERLLPALERLGRARLVRDRRTLDELRRSLPPVFEEDFEWVRSRLSGELLSAAGAVELVTAFGRRDAIGDLASVLSSRASPLLKDVVIEALGALGGDGAAAALLTAVRGEADEGLRARAVSALGAFPGPEAVAALSAALGDPSPVVRTAASGAMARMPSREAVEALLRAMGGEADPRLQADFAIGAYAAGGEAWREAVVQAILARPAVLQVVEERRRARDESRYLQAYPRAFFEGGQPAVPRPPSARRIGVTVETGPGRTLPEVASRLFAAAPLDRYRDWFRLRRAEEFPSPRAYDAGGNPAGDVPYDDLDGTVYLRFRDPGTFDPGVLGYTKGCEAFVTNLSMVHEFGHAFARLGDEYPDGSTADAANLARQAPPAWEPLIRSSTLPSPLRRDQGFLVPSGDCHMANRPGPTRFCPVCQLEIHARMWELGGSPLPW